MELEEKEEENSEKHREKPIIKSPKIKGAYWLQI